MSKTSSIALIVGLAVLGAASAAGAADKPSFVADGTLAVCTDPTFPPMEFMAAAGDKEPSGFDIDLSRALAAAWGVELQIATMDFSGLLPSLGAGRCDLVASGILLTPERQKSFDAAPYFATEGILIGRAGTPAVDLKDLSGKTIAVQTGTSYVQQMEAVNAKLKELGLEPAIVQLYPKATDVIQQVELGRVFGGTSQDTELAYREASAPGKYVRIFGFKGADIFAVYFRKDEADGAAVAATIGTLGADGTLGKIAGAWKLPASQLEAGK